MNNPETGTSGRSVFSIKSTDKRINFEEVCDFLVLNSYESFFPLAVSSQLNEKKNKVLNSISARYVVCQCFVNQLFADAEDHATN